MCLVYFNNLFVLQAKSKNLNIPTLQIQGEVQRRFIGIFGHLVEYVEQQNIFASSTQRLAMIYDLGSRAI